MVNNISIDNRPLFYKYKNQSWYHIFLVAFLLTLKRSTSAEKVASSLIPCFLSCTVAKVVQQLSPLKTQNAFVFFVCKLDSKFGIYLTQVSEYQRGKLELVSLGYFHSQQRNMNLRKTNQLVFRQLSMISQFNHLLEILIFCLYCKLSLGSVFIQQVIVAQNFKYLELGKRNPSQKKECYSITQTLHLCPC